LDANDDRLVSGVQVEIPYGVTHRAHQRQSAKEALKLGKAADGCRIVRGSTFGATNERGNRSGHSSDGAHTARNFLDVNARVG